MYVKLFSSILTSSVWAEDMPTRIVWITMLALADKEGDVRASPSGLARLANVTTEDCQQALAKFLAPDTESGTQEYEGRRIEERAGGWHILNYVKYREILDIEARKEQWRKDSKAYRERHKSQKPSVRRQKVSAESAHAVAVTEAETKAGKQRAPFGATWLTPYIAIWEEANGAGSGESVAGRLARALKPLHDANGVERVCAQLRVYLDQTEARFASPQAFAQRFASWGESRAEPTKSDQSIAALKGWLNTEHDDGEQDSNRGNPRLLAHPLPGGASDGRGS